MRNNTFIAKSTSIPTLTDEETELLHHFTNLRRDLFGQHNRKKLHDIIYEYLQEDSNGIEIKSISKVRLLYQINYGNNNIEVFMKEKQDGIIDMITEKLSFNSGEYQSKLNEVIDKYREYNIIDSFLYFSVITSKQINRKAKIAFIEFII